MLVVPALGPHSQHVICPACHTDVYTEVDKEITTKTHMFAVLLCFVCCPLSCLPYCLDTCKASSHYCPNCGAYLGTYN
uniref:Lipopolysaccharide-induced tumor necrosis factor-alpha factor-like protein n=1 Tax=Triatoma infestans TaxID=30076 RepID=A0A161MIM9_TRIIF